MEHGTLELLAAAVHVHADIGIALIPIHIDRRFFQIDKPVAIAYGIF